MKHLGDITKINWFDVDPVDVVTGGSPCQDLSVAGKRAGLAGERSGLYMEQIRCVKELRKADELRGRTGQFIRPRYMVWENVPGAFSSGNPKGADFAAVIEEIIKICEPDADVCILPPGNGWTKSGCYYADDGRWSIAWRVHDAQFWGVPQRRKRIALVADFGGLSAPEILFERKGLSGDFEQGGAQREETAGATGNSVKSASECLTGWDCQSKRIFSPDGICATLNSGDREGGNITPSVFYNSISFQERAGKPGGGKGILIQNERTGALSTLNNQSVFNIGSFHSNSWKSDNPHSGVYETEVSKTLDALNCGAPTCNQGGTAVVERVIAVDTYNQTITGDIACSLTAVGAGDPTKSGSCLKAGESGTNRTPTVFDARGNGGGRVVCTLTGDHQNRVTDYTALCIGNGFSYNCIHPVRCANVVRRLTPLECERLQGYPDGWTDIGEWVDSKGKKHKEADSPRYKALGNSIALPFWFWLLRRIASQYERPATLGSLFDGIGGFPLCWERCNGKGTALWASEIEEFPMAVTKVQFPEV